MDAKRIDEHASRKLAICQLWRDGQLSAKDCERQCGEQDALLAVEAVAEQIAAHVRGFHGPASAVENDTAADVKEEDRWYMLKGGNAIWVFPQRLVYSASLPFGVQSDSTEADMTNDPVATRVMVSTARARIDAWQAAKQTKPAPSSAQAPERVMVNISPANGNAVAAWSPHELAPEGIVLHPYVRGDIAEGLNGKLALANARIAELEKWNETLLEKLAEYRKRVGAAHALD